MRAIREKAGLTQQELAEYFEVSRQTVTKWESKEEAPEFFHRAIKLYVLLERLGLSIADLDNSN